MSGPKVVTIKKDILAKNDEIAQAIRARLAETGVTAINFTSSPGSGKTTLLARTLTDLKGELNIAVLEGDQETDNDARKIAETGAKVVQINTVSACHLDANMVSRALNDLDFAGTDMLFIENVGNLVCPASYDLGEKMKVALLSVTEGDDKPLKYPKMFRVAGAMIITKTDLAPHVDFDIDLCEENARKVNPGIHIVRLSAKTGDGLSAWYEYLKSLAN